MCMRSGHVRASSFRLLTAACVRMIPVVPCISLRHRRRRWARWQRSARLPVWGRRSIPITLGAPVIPAAVSTAPAAPLTFTLRRIRFGRRSDVPIIARVPLLRKAARALTRREVIKARFQCIYLIVHLTTTSPPAPTSFVEFSTGVIIFTIRAAALVLHNAFLRVICAPILVFL